MNFDSQHISDEFGSHCPLCGSSATQIVDTTSQLEIAALYVEKFNLHIDACDIEIKRMCCTLCELVYFSPATPGDETLYEKLQEFEWYYMEEKWEYECSMQDISTYSSILEVGAGKAAYANFVGKEQYVGLEYSDKSIESARQSGIELHKQSVEEHALEGELYDVVVSFQVLEHVSDPSGFLNGCVSCLKSGGKLIISVPSCEGFAGKAVNDALNMPPHHVTRWPKSTLEYVARKFDLELIRIEYESVANYHEMWARRALIENRLRRLLRWKNCLVDRSFSGKVLYRLAKLCAFMMPWITKDVRGHTVLAVYNKN